VFWWRKAAERGDPESQYNLAFMYSKGQGVAQNQQMAFYWFAEAAGQGVLSAQSRLGLMYATGEGVAADVIEAHKWFFIAAKGGDEAAMANRIRSESMLDQPQIAEAERRAQEWARVH
jgi:TPR repeat protein